MQKYACFCMHIFFATKQTKKTFNNMDEMTVSFRRIKDDNPNVRLNRVHSKGFGIHQYNKLIEAQTATHTVTSSSNAGDKRKLSNNEISENPRVMTAWYKMSIWSLETCLQEGGTRHSYLVGPASEIYNKFIFDPHKVHSVHEVMTTLENHGIHLFVDVDAYIEYNPHLATHEVQDQTLRLIMKELLEFAQDRLSQSSDNVSLNVYQSPQSQQNKLKLSYHLLMKIDSHAFKDIRSVGAFMRNFENEMYKKYGVPSSFSCATNKEAPQNPFLVYGKTKENGNAYTLGFLIDLSYTDNKNFRVLGSCKVNDVRKKQLIASGALYDDVDTVEFKSPTLDNTSNVPSYTQFIDSSAMVTCMNPTLIEVTEPDGSIARSMSGTRTYIHLLNATNTAGVSGFYQHASVQLFRSFGPECSSLKMIIEQVFIKNYARKCPEIKNWTINYTNTAVHNMQSFNTFATEILKGNETHLPAPSCIVSIKDHYCVMIGRCHTSNHVGFSVNLVTFRITPRCFSCGPPSKEVCKLKGVNIALDEKTKIAIWKTLGMDINLAQQISELMASRFMHSSSSSSLSSSSWNRPNSNSNSSVNVDISTSVERVLHTNMTHLQVNMGQKHFEKMALALVMRDHNSPPPPPYECVASRTILMDPKNVNQRIYIVFCKDKQPNMSECKECGQAPYGHRYEFAPSIHYASIPYQIWSAFDSSPIPRQYTHKWYCLNESCFDDHVYQSFHTY
jgi:hypothetical protein